MDGGLVTTIRTKTLPHQLLVDNHKAILLNHSPPSTFVHDMPQRGVSFVLSNCSKVLEFNSFKRGMIIEKIEFK